MEPVGVAELIARIAGPVYVIVSFGLFLNPEGYRRMAVHFFEQPALGYLAGLLALALGVAILTFHFVWRADWTVLVTILGCLGIAKGAALIMAPGWMLRIWEPLLAKPAVIRAGGLGGLVLGLFLAAKGYALI
jgi:hypothetical protein